MTRKELVEDVTDDPCTIPVPIEHDTEEAALLRMQISRDRLREAAEALDRAHAAFEWWHDRAGAACERHYDVVNREPVAS